MEIKKSSLILGLISSFLLPITPSVKADSEETYALNTSVTIKGALSIEKKYGPPNYGENPETDKVEMITVLKLSTPITVFHDKNAETIYLKNQSSIHMGIKKELRKFSLKNGICMQVSGELYEAVSGHHHYPLMISVTNIEKC